MKAHVAAIAGMALAVMPMPARAGPPEAPFSGTYAGFNAGAAWGTSGYATDSGCAPSGINAVFCEAGASAINGPAVANSGSGDLSTAGFTGGIQGGHNWQRGRIVYGGEADFGAFDLGDSSAVNGTFPFTFLGDSYSLTNAVSTDWLATIRGRLGVAVRPELLLYATGGVAFSDFEFSSAYSDNAIDSTFPGGTGTGRESGVRIGWVLGGGGEWLLDGPWSVKTEYLYTDFGSEDFAVPLSNTAAFTQTMRVKADLTAHIARVGLNYRY